MGGIAQTIQTVAAVTGIAADVTYLRGHAAAKRAASSPSPAAMGDIGSTITNLASAVGIASDLANDPYLPEVICRVSQLKAINAGQRPGTCVKTAKGLRGGVGMGRFVEPLRAYVYAEQHRWVYAAAFAGIVGVPLLIGYALGKGSK
jgi:hypothetical protein